MSRDAGEKSAVKKIFVNAIFILYVSVTQFLDFCLRKNIFVKNSNPGNNSEKSLKGFISGIWFIHYRLRDWEVIKSRGERKEKKQQKILSGGNFRRSQSIDSENRETDDGKANEISFLMSGI